MKAYLAGAIEFSPDKGKSWRDDISGFLSYEFGHDSYNPLIEEHKILTKDERETFRSLKSTNLDGFKRIVRKLMLNDLNTIADEIDYMICNWDVYAAKGGGTYGELTFAFYRNIPVYMVAGESLEKISGWILSCTTEIFSNFAQLKEFLIRKYR